MSQLEKFRSTRLIAVFVTALVAGVVFGFGASVWATSLGTDLSVSGNGTITGTLAVTGATTVTATVDVQSSTATSTLSTGGFNVGSGQFIIQQTSGRVGIASTTPWGLFSIEQTSMEWIFAVADKGTSTPSLVVVGNGRVGIGTSTPAERLSVHGNLLVAGTSSVSALIATGTAILATEAGNVGVGTTSPVQKLSVGGSLFVGASAVGGTIGGFGVGNATTTAGAIENTGNVLFGDAAGDIAMFASGDIRYNNIGTTTISRINVAGWSIATSTSPAPLVRYDTTNTRVGIATGTPTATFTVKGDTYTTGGFKVGEGEATTTPGIIETASTSRVSLFRSDVNIISSGTTTLGIHPIDTAGSMRRGCIEFGGVDGTFSLYATTTGPAILNAGPCEAAQ